MIGQGQVLGPDLWLRMLWIPVNIIFDIYFDHCA